MPSVQLIVVFQDLDGYSTFLVSPATCIFCVQTMNQSFQVEKERSQQRLKCPQSEGMQPLA